MWTYGCNKFGQRGTTNEEKALTELKLNLADGESVIQVGSGWSFGGVLTGIKQPSLEFLRQCLISMWKNKFLLYDHPPDSVCLELLLNVSLSCPPFAALHLDMIKL